MIENSDSLPEKKRPGGQPGNQNARTHGFYSRALTSAQQDSLQAAGDLRGVDNEIAMLRVKIFSILEEAPANTAVLLRAVTALTRLVKVRTQCPDEDKPSMQEAICNALAGLIPKGYDPGPLFKLPARPESKSPDDPLRKTAPAPGPCLPEDSRSAPE
jgi:hypothetical protein